MSEEKLEIPEYLRELAKNLNAQSRQDLNALIASSISVPRLSLRGRVFRFIEEGEEVFKCNDSVEVIILGTEPGPGLMNKTWYEKGYTSGSSAPPDCASTDGIHPDSWVTKPQNADCKTCPKNIFGSATNQNTGKATKACKDSKRIWLTRVNGGDYTNPTIYGCNITVSSLRAFSEFGRKLTPYNLPLPAVITKLIMVDAEFPQLDFQIAGFVPQEALQPLLAKSEERPWRLVTSIALALPDGGNESTKALPNQIKVEEVKDKENKTSEDNLLDNW